MKALAEQLPQPNQEINQRLRHKTDAETWLAETLNGSMQTSFEFTSDGNELYGEDGGAMREVFDDAIQEALLLAEENPTFIPEVRRRLIEREELTEEEAMARGELPNTMVVVSDFVPEYMDRKEDVGGYNVTRQQTFLRIITCQPNGTIKVTSQTLDGSNRQALEAIYAAMGQTSKEGELLGQRIHRDLPAEWQDKLADNLTDVYDASLKEQHGGEWHAGIRQPDERAFVNTYDFACQQKDLISWFTNQKLANPQAAEKSRYNLAATVAARYERFLNSRANSDHPIGSPVRVEDFIIPANIAAASGLNAEMRYEGKKAASDGKEFSGCGGTVKAESDDDFSIKDASEELGYGNRRGSRSGSDKYGSLKFKCPNTSCGKVNTREPNKLLKNCQHCKKSVECK